MLVSLSRYRNATTNHSNALPFTNQRTERDKEENWPNNLLLYVEIDNITHTHTHFILST